MVDELMMPQMGYDMTEGTVVRWLKSEGDQVDIGEPIAEIETDKAVVEFESFTSGILLKILEPEGSTIPVGKPIAIVGDKGEVIPELEEPQTSTTDSMQPSVADQKTHESAKIMPPEETTPVSKTGIKASPAARRIAEDRGIDLSKVSGTGPMGRITKDDILNIETEKNEDETSSSKAQPNKVPLTKMRQQIARVTVSSKQEKPHFYISSDIDMTKAMELRNQINQSMETDDIHISVNDMIIKACVKALKIHPKFNAFFTEEGIQMNTGIDIGIAIATDDGLVVPAIMKCANKSIKDISVSSKDLARRTKEGTLTSQEYTGATFAISNLGMFDVSSFTAIIHPPQSAVLAVGTITDKPVIRNKQITIAQVMTATLSADHRIVDGAEGARFIVDIKNFLETPLNLVDIVI